MKKTIITSIFLIVSSSFYAGPACCGSAAKGKKIGANELGSASAAQAQKEFCSLDKLNEYIKNGKTLSTDELKGLLSTNADFVLVDARTPKWDDGKRIGSAKNLTPQSSDAEIHAAIATKDSYVITYCGSTECPLSHKMANRLKEMGYANVVVYADGIAGWKESGNLVN